MISRRDEEGFSSCLACPCHRAVASTPPRQRCRIGQISAPHVAFALRLRARPSVSLIFEATFAFTVVTARWLVISPRKTLSIGFRVLVSLHPLSKLRGFGLLPRQVYLLLNTPAFAGHTTDHESFLGIAAASPRCTFGPSQQICRTPHHSQHRPQCNRQIRYLVTCRRAPASFFESLSR